MPMQLVNCAPKFWGLAGHTSSAICLRRRKLIGCQAVSNNKVKWVTILQELQFRKTWLVIVIVVVVGRKVEGVLRSLQKLGSRIKLLESLRLGLGFVC